MGEFRRRLMMSVGGAEPVSPVFYDYLYFDGVADITTDISLPNLASFAVPLGKETNKASQALFGCESSNANRIRGSYTGNTTSTKRYFGTYYGATNNLTPSRTLAFSTQTFNYFLTPKRVGYNSTAWTISKGSGYPESSAKLRIGGWTSYNPYSGRMGTFRIYGSDAQNATTYDEITAFTPVITLRPCTYNGEAGLWCVETSTFYGNTAGAGTLTASNS